MRLPFLVRGAEKELAAGRAIEARVSAGVPFEGRGAALGPALERYRRALGLARRGSAVWVEAAFRLGSLLAGENSVRDVERAIPLLEAVVGTVEGYHPAYYYLGEAYVLSRQFDRAEEVWRRGLALDPTRREVRDVLARLPLDRVRDAARRSDHGAVVAAVERVPAAERSAEAWVCYGDALAALGRVAEAGQAWRRALSLEPLKGMRQRFRSVGLPPPRDD
ncbi:MAG TPA: tetratricopeptide repeat protein [Chloroflexota bacterium]|jgi:tetratricopeptide (TPR) repeat protein|nr:tetratricopeptide repeat protein [Chloroflexota bacterium]